MFFVILLALAALVVILFLGLFNMVRPTEDSAQPKRAQKLMRWRVWAQAFVLLLLALAAAFS